jgi:uncharacterized protein YecE (DUF72 family)
MQLRLGTVDLPARIDRERYFRDLDYLELGALFPGPLKPAALAKWKLDPADDARLGLVAPWVLTMKQPPADATRAWAHDATIGEFRDSAPARAALVGLATAVAALSPSCVVFRSPPLFAASAANRDRLRAFFGELATTENLPGVERVWIPDGLWDLRTAIAFANELGVTCAIDPLVREPGQPPEIFEDLDATSLYFRISGLGRTGPVRSERLEDLAALIDHYQERPITVAFDSPQRWADARNLKQLLAP